MKKKTGAQLVRYALEQLGVRYTFGIPGVHNTEIYDELASSEQITPIRVNHEASAAFMADATSRTSGIIGALVIAPAAGTTMASPGIGEAFLEGIPMLVISGGVRNDYGFSYQLHQLDQLALVGSITKGCWRAESHADIVPMIYEAWHVANRGEPGPTFVEIPLNLQLFPGDVENPPQLDPLPPPPCPAPGAIGQAASRLAAAKHPGLFLGWGCRDSTGLAVELAERLGAPVATTLQGLSVFPATHPLHTGMGIGSAAVPAASNAFAKCDVLLAVGTRFGEVATGSFGIESSWKLIHCDINPKVFNVNYPATIALAGDASCTLQALLQQLPPAGSAKSEAAALCDRIAGDKRAYLNEWLRHDSRGRVNPARFFIALRQRLDDDAYLLADAGNHTFLVAELFSTTLSKHVLSPTDFNCMGYCVPAAIGVKLAHPNQQVVGIIGDGGFLMTGLEMLTAAEHGLGIVYFVFNDGDLAQVSEIQSRQYNRKTCTVLPPIRIRSIADAVGAEYFEMQEDVSIDSAIDHALAASSKGRPVVVDVRIDYSKDTRFTKGIVKTNLARMSWHNKLRTIGRAAWRRVDVPA